MTEDYKTECCTQDETRGDNQDDAFIKEIQEKIKMYRWRNKRNMFKLFSVLPECRPNTILSTIKDLTSFQKTA